MELVKILILKGDRLPKHFYKDRDVSWKKLFEWELDFNPTMKFVNNKNLWNFGGGVKIRNGNGIMNIIKSFFYYKYIGWMWRWNENIKMFQVIPTFSENSENKNICNIEANVKIGIKIYIYDGKIVSFIAKHNSDDVFIEHSEIDSQIFIIKELPFQLNSLTKTDSNLFLTLNRKFT